MRALVVGQAPSRDTDGRPPFSGRSGANLAALLGVRHSKLLSVVDAVNLVQRWPGPSPSGKGDAWPRAEARAAGALLLALAPHDRVVACGRNVCDALGLRLDPLERRTVGRRLFLHLPHPSRVVRFWNDPANVAAASAALRQFVAADLRAVC